LYRNTFSSFQFFTGTSSGLDYLFRQDIVVISNRYEETDEGLLDSPSDACSELGWGLMLADSLN
jgi:hypothetical protein